ncbi:MAG: hypothetical protein K5639_08805 [Eubacterium sp.]|nr:hypothetical protein [Eubacterium sp.]
MQDIKESWSVEDLLNLTETQQDEIENLKSSQKEREKEWENLKSDYLLKIQNLSSSNSLLKGQVQIDTDDIKSRDQQINRLISYTTVLNKNIQKVREQSNRKSAEAEKALAECDEKIAEGVKAQAVLIRDEYRRKYLAKESWHIAVFSFCSLWCVVWAVASEHLQRDAVFLAQAMRGYCIDRFKNIKASIGWVKDLCSGISNETVESVVSSVSMLLVGFGHAVLFYGSLIALLFLSFRYLTDRKRFDAPARWVMVGTAVPIIALSYVKIPYLGGINWILVFLVIQAVFALFRSIQRKWKALRDRYDTNADVRRKKTPSRVIDRRKVVGVLLKVLGCVGMVAGPVVMFWLLVR